MIRNDPKKYVRAGTRARSMLSTALRNPESPSSMSTCICATAEDGADLISRIVWLAQEAVNGFETLDRETATQNAVHNLNTIIGLAKQER